MKWGIDISEHNRPLNWPRLKKQGLSFVILRLGWGAGHLDSRFYEYANGVELEVYPSANVKDPDYQCEIWIAVEPKKKA